MRTLTFASLVAVLALSACEKETTELSGPVAVIDETVENTAAMPTAEQEAEHVEACEGDKAEGEASCGMPGSGCNQWDEAAMEVTRRDVPADAVWKTWEVDGMTCGGCERRVMAHVGKVDGVVAVKANAGTGRVSIAVAPGNEAQLDPARAEIDSLGYKVGNEAPTL